MTHDSAISSCSSSSHADGSYSVSSPNISKNMDSVSQTDPTLQLNEAERKKSMNEFNQIYKQIPHEKERRKFLV